MAEFQAGTTPAYELLSFLNQLIFQLAKFMILRFELDEDTQHIVSRDLIRPAKPKRPTVGGKRLPSDKVYVAWLNSSRGILSYDLLNVVWLIVIELADVSLFDNPELAVGITLVENGLFWRIDDPLELHGKEIQDAVVVSLEKVGLLQYILIVHLQNLGLHG